MADNAIARKMGSSKEAHAKMVDDAIAAVHSVPNAPRHIAIPVLHALLLGKHFVLKGLKVPEHLQDPPKSDQKKADDSGDKDKSSADDDEESDHGD